MKKVMLLTLAYILLGSVQIYAFDYKTTVHVEQSIITKQQNINMKLDFSFGWEIDKKNSKPQIKGKCLSIKGTFESIEKIDTGTFKVIVELDWNKDKDVEPLKKLIEGVSLLEDITFFAERELQFGKFKDLSSEREQDKLLESGTPDPPFIYKTWGRFHEIGKALLYGLYTPGSAVVENVEKIKAGDVLIDIKSPSPEVFDVHKYVKVVDITEDKITIEIVSKSKPGKQWSHWKDLPQEIIDIAAPKEHSEHILELKVTCDNKKNKPISVEGIFNFNVYDEQMSCIIGRFSQKVSVKIE